MRPTLLLIGLMMATAASAQNMPLHEFVQRGTSLEKKGPLALFSKGEIDKLQAEMKAASTALRAERLAAEKAGRKPAYCPPTKQKPMGVRALLAELRGIAPGQPRSASLSDGLRVMLARKYPCPA